ncbi:hypothetical protein ACVW0V_005820 [Bradyrhizobium elkanii]
MPIYGVHPDSSEFFRRIGRILFQRPFIVVDPLFFGFLRRLPNEEIRRYRRAQDGDEGRQEGGIETHVGNQNAFQSFVPGHLHDGERNHVGEQAERQPLQHGNVSVVVEEDLGEDRHGAEQHHVRDAGAADQELEGVRHGSEVGGDIDRVGHE